jgi:hypothetical protein
MFPGGAAAAAAPLTLAFNASATSSASTINNPASGAAGDILVLLDLAGNTGGSTPSQVIPSGFTLIGTQTGSTGGGLVGLRATASYKLSVGSETSLTGQNGSFSNSKVLVRFRGSQVVSSLSLLGVANPGGTSGNPAAQNITASSGTPPLIVLGFYGTMGTVDPRTMSPAKDGEVDNSSGLYIAYKIYNASPVNVSVDMDDEGDANFLMGCYIECA